MIQSPIPRALSTLLKHKIEALLIGGQACIIYGAAEFSRDIDLAIMVSSENLDKLRSALNELKAKRIFFPDLSENVLTRGHACHFRCNREDIKGLRIDVLGIMRSVDPFHELWKRRKVINLPEIGEISIIALSDLVKSKKTQRDKDWPMIRRLIESDIVNASEDPPDEQISFWLAECRTPELLVSLANKYKKISNQMISSRSLLKTAIEGNQSELSKLLYEEENKEKELDREYWAPLKKELEVWRQSNSIRKK